MMEGSSKFEIPQELRSMAESSVEQTRKAFDSFLSAAHKTAQTIEGQSQAAREGAKDLGTKAISYAEKNVTASLDYAERLIRANDVGEVLRLHNEYVQEQVRTLAEQARELGQTVTRSAMDTTKPR
jgi:phasin